MNHELAKTLTTALVQFIDRERTEGTMCCSNIECGALEEAFKSDNLNDVEAFIQKKLSRLTEFEESLRQIIVEALSGETPNGGGGTMSWAIALSNDDVKKLAPKVLTLAKKELFKQGEGTYYYVPKNGELTYIDSMPMRMPYAVPETHTLRPLCWEPGGTCTNPHFDCINCPKKTSGGIFTSPNTNTASGTSTLKAEG